MPGKTLFQGDISIKITGAAESAEAMRALEASVSKTIAAMEKARQKADETSKGFRDMRQMDESVKALERLNRAAMDLAKSQKRSGEANDIYLKSLRQVEKDAIKAAISQEKAAKKAADAQVREAERAAEAQAAAAAKTAEKQEQVNQALSRFRDIMDGMAPASQGVLGAYRGINEALSGQEQGLQKVFTVGKSVFGLWHQMDTALQVVKGGGNIFRGLRLAIAGTEESSNVLVKTLDRASNTFDSLRRASQFGFRFEAAIGDAQKLVKNLDTLRVSSDSLAQSMKGVSGANFASLHQQMLKASNGASSLAQTMMRTGEVNESAFRNTEAQIQRTIERLLQLRKIAVDQFGENSPQVKGIDELIGRYRESNRELLAIRERINQNNSAVANFTRNILSKIPVVGGFFKGVGDAAERSSNRIQKAAGAARELNKSFSGASGPIGQLGSALHLVNQDTLQASYGFGNMSQGMIAAIGVMGGLAGTLSQLHPAFGAIIAGAAAMAQRMIASFQVMANAAATDSQKIRAAVTGLGTILTGFGAAATASIVSMGTWAAQVEAKMIGLQVSAKNLGIPMDYLRDKIETLKETGIETSVAVDSLLQFLKADLPTEHIEGLARSAQDLAKSLGKDSSETFQRFIYFIQTGNSALLDGIGIARNASDMYDTFAKEIGKTANSLSVQEKRQALVNGLMQEAANVSGIYELASKSVAGRLSSMTRQFNELRLEIGKEFQPLLLVLVNRFTDLIKALRDMPASTKRTIGFITSLVAVFGTLLGVTLLLAPSITSLIGLFGTLGITLSAALPIVGLLGAAILALFAIFKALPVHTRGVQGIADRFSYLIDKVSEFANTAVAKIKEFTQPIVELVQSHIPGLINAFTGLRDRILEIFSGISIDTSILNTLITVLKDMYAILYQIIDSGLSALEAALNQDWESMWRNLARAGENALAALLELFVGFVPKAFEWGSNMIFSFARGLLEAARNAIPSVMDYVGGVMADFLQTHSPARKGPLKKVVAWGAGAASSFASGFGKGQTAIGRGLGAFGGAFAGMTVQANEWGKKLTGTFAEGIASQARGAIAPAMDVVGGMVSRFLKGASPPPEGPLSSIDQWGKTAFETFLSGFEQADYSIFDKAVGLVKQRLDILYMDVKEKGGMIASALLQARQVLAEGISGVRAGTISLTDFQGLADQIATPVRDVFDVIAKTLQAEAAKEAVASLQESIAAAREARQEAIEAQQDRIRAIQKAIRSLQKDEKRIRKEIEEEAKKRAEQMGIVVDPKLLDALKRRLEAASREVQRAQIGLEKIQSKRQRYGISLISWEEINAQAALDLAKQREAEARLAVQEEEDKQKQIDDLKKQLEEERSAELEAIQARIEALQENAEKEQEKLQDMQDAAQKAARAEDKQLRAAQAYANEMAKQAALAEAALKERLENEKLLAEIAKAEAEATEETVKEAFARRSARKPRARGRAARAATPEESGILAQIRAIIAGGPKAVLQAILKAVYNVAKGALALFGIDIDDVLADLRGRIESVKAWVAGIKEKWAGPINAIIALWNKAKENIGGALAKLRGSFGNLGESFRNLGESIGELWNEKLKPLIDKLLDSKAVELLKKLWGVELKIIFGTLAVAIISIINTIVNALSGLITAMSGVVDTIAGVIDLIAGIIGGDSDKIFSGFEKIKSGIGNILKGVGEIILAPFKGVVDTILAFLGFEDITTQFEKFKKKVEGIVKGFVDKIVGFFENLYKKVVGRSIIPDLVNGIVEWIEKLPSKVGAAIERFVSSILNALGNLAIDAAKKALDIADAIMAPIDNLLKNPPKITLSILTQGMEAAKQLIDNVTSAWNTILSTAASTTKTFVAAGMNGASSLISGITTAWGNLVDSASQTTKTLVKNGLDGAKDLVNGVTTAWNSLVYSAASTLKTLTTNGITGDIATTIGRVWTNWAGLAAAAASKTVTFATSGISTTISNTINSIKNGWNGLIAGTKSITLSIFGSITRTIADILDDIRYAWNSIIYATSTKTITLTLAGLFEKTTTTIKSIVDLFERVVAAWKSFLGLGAYGGGLSVNLNPGSLSPLTFPHLEISQFQAGGIAMRKMLALVGERGPEAIIPLRDLPGIIAMVAEALSSRQNRRFGQVAGGRDLVYSPVLNFYGTPEPGRVRREVVQAGTDWVFQTRR